MNHKEETLALEQLIDRLCLRFPAAGRAVVAEIVHRIYQDFDGLPVRSYLPVLIEREALQCLQARVSPAHAGAEPVVAG